MADEQHKGGIWKLFGEVQRNILYLHKQRLVAMEEPKKLQMKIDRFFRKWRYFWRWKSKTICPS